MSAAANPAALGRPFLLRSTPTPSSAASAQSPCLRCPRLTLGRRMEAVAPAAIADSHSEPERDLSASAVASEALGASVAPDFGVDVETKEPSVATILTSFENSFDAFGSMSTPLYQTATFKQPSATENGPYDYTRSGNPTRDVLQSLMAKLEKADQAFCFTSGMAALAAVTHLLKSGQEIVAGEDIYGGSDRLLSQVAPRNGIVVKRIDTTKISEVTSAIGPLTKLVWLESPTNPRQQITDIKKIAEIAHYHGALVLVDNSIMSPVLSHPLELGADIVMHSATKFIAGHSDLMAGILAVKGKSLSKEIAFLQNAEGSGLAPFDCWLCLRGIKTMALRVEKQQVKLFPYAITTYRVSTKFMGLCFVLGLLFNNPPSTHTHTQKKHPYVYVCIDLIFSIEEIEDHFIIVRLMLRRLLNS
ncbi:hypothetical protein GUJ93_ZPchr0012g18784 [Zizania palustris]|uniref:cysteine-S-conjugate beta-lyase n=1 Tax=Zizania palustris TaxID=103762 RepID=A0A8J5WVA6_ZIZPA|nr:hypothetical protein GUJ93_ZPchr0012g18784 [Zizania palustris]KAG8093829.1 hypothetical protein GUJ93_ZPchr0012g18784 [Zizania palustris]